MKNDSLKVNKKISNYFFYFIKVLFYVYITET